MYLTLPDLHPGRCLNHRDDGQGYGGQLRCLEREGTAHVCRFPEPPPRHTSRGATEWTAPQPQPWVVPPR